MAAIRTARERAREELTREIKAEARRQLGVEGAQKLSLRAVARELGMVSSALYRYFPSRDDLLTALIIDAYNALGDRVDAAVAAAPADDVRARWAALCNAARSWAIASPHEYALVYGTPVPGYTAPQETVAPAARVPLAVMAMLGDNVGGFRLETAPRPLRGLLAQQMADLAALIAPDLNPVLLARSMAAWAQVFGLISFELFGQFVGSAEPADGLFAYSVEDLADHLGLAVGAEHRP
ncbi:TetR/AcrR family transcriptional regulator [Streptacidiphilus sp. PB12-B1b]|uniref:TetR/AcrR family transcriptional regulator n=1 Tax=Streptacidiphilus sp. PB12-B1b TaxID=2705012 RepID=UPI0015FD42F8|nr:TetR/AcrR family transcriptional regulator [Streptacidiphilus sp. PB12-B1b]QMU76534.1 TetR/AcrR family transcriptional regulator [Streptacidiphilus sp. PB12-B1b]